MMEALSDNGWLAMEELGSDGDDFVSITFSKEKYPARLHAQNVADILQESGVNIGLIYLWGQRSVTFPDSDQPPVFRQLRYFFYLSGLNVRDCAITYDIGKQELRAWIPPPNTGRNVIYNGQIPSVEEIMAEYDFNAVDYVDKLKEYLASYHGGPKKKIYVLHPNLDLRATLWNIHPASIDTKLLKPAMNAARAIKSDYEIEMTRKASKVTAAAHTSVLRAIKGLTNETEVEGLFIGVCIGMGAKQQAYGLIAGSGENSSTLHYIANNENLAGRELLCLDAGCEWDCYASDVTRTFPISGKFSVEGKAIYDIVEQMQEECIAMVKPGANYRDIHIHAHKVALKGLMELGVLHNGKPEEIFAAGATTAFLPHGLGHYLGLECHDVGDGGNLLFGLQQFHSDWTSAFAEMLDEKSTANPSLLRERHIITVEPGLYFNRYALEDVWLKDEKVAKFIDKDLLEKYYPVGGARIEDDILVTKDGYENLTTAPKGKEALKIINGDGGLMMGRR